MDNAPTPISTAIPGFTIRFATADDAELILSFIEQLAEYEKLSHEVVATAQKIEKHLFGEDPKAEVIIGEYRNVAVGFALFYHTFSTFLAKPGLYLEDLFVNPDARGNGFGKTMLSFLARLAVERNCGRLEWWVLDWNESAIAFYKQLGGEPMDNWTTYRVSGDTLHKLSRRFDE